MNVILQSLQSFIDMEGIWSEPIKYRIYYILGLLDEKLTVTSDTLLISKDGSLDIKSREEFISESASVRLTRNSLSNLISKVKDANNFLAMPDADTDLISSSLISARLYLFSILLSEVK